MELRPDEHSDPRVLKTREAALASARALLLSQGVAAITHLHVAQHSGIGRKTLYRHWPTVGELLYETFSTANFPHAKRTGDLHADLVGHLEALRRGLVDGPLVYLIHALNEKAATDPQMALMRDRLTEEGCAPLREILRDAIKARQLPQRFDVEEAAAELEGPLFYRTLVRNEKVSRRIVIRLVDRFFVIHTPGQ
jgi:AcrR family transcriptional regulator